ncbi:MAG: LPS export ABC transporter permease LptG [Halieaceae bacterium]|nr:LPS export ABC transporter permease LptG [Halieaceae bacterium]
MRKLRRYISGTVLAATGAVLVVLVGLDALSAVVDESQDISDTYGFLEVLTYVGLTLPRRIHEFVPFAALIGALVGLGRLASGSELVVVRTAGVSMGSLALAVLQPALIAALFGFLVGEFVSPGAEQMAISQRALAQRSDSSVTGRHGTWNRDGKTFIHADAVQRGGVIFGVTLLSYDDQRSLVRAMHANRGTYFDDHWLLEDVQETRIGDLNTEVIEYTTWRWDTEITPNLLVLEAVEPESLPVQQLWPYARYLRQQGLMSGDIELAFWRKVLQPLAIGGLVLVAMSFIFGPLRDGSMGARIFAGVIVGVIFRISQDFFGPASLIFGFAPLLAALAPIAVCWLAGGLLLWRRQ